MHHSRIAVALATLIWTAAACDGSDTIGTGGAVGPGDAPNGSGDMTLDQHAPKDATQTTPNTATQAAPNTATQAAPNTATQAPTNTGGPGGSGALVGCVRQCEHASSLACDDSEPEMTCAEVCDLMQAIPSCTSVAQSLLTCVAAASTCEALDACSDNWNWFECASDSISPEVDPDPPTNTVPSISDPSNCNVGSLCQGCDDLCDACVCGAGMAGYTTAQMTTTCASLCE